MAVKKKWYDIEAPKEFGGKVISQTFAADPKNLIDRVIKISYADITQDFNKFFIKLHLRITKVDETTCKTELVAHSVQNDRIYRMVRRRARKVTAIQKVKTKDGKDVRVKTTIILPSRVNTSMQGRIRTKAKELIDEKAKTVGYIDFSKILILGSFVMEIKKQCSKIYPVSQIEFHKSELLPVLDKEEIKESVKEEPKEEVKEEVKETPEVKEETKVDVKEKASKVEKVTKVKEIKKK
ncbi:hypothetical protein CL614_04910 [archaeon]|nr:hypothetical protein [archaeon]|tara:strand:+ start:2959 stop:3672 length:714 start_codon:yes stop_codon:yes gene_type:complete